MSARRRVAITGLGLVTPTGNDVATTWSALLEGAERLAGAVLIAIAGILLITRIVG